MDAGQRIWIDVEMSAQITTPRGWDRQRMPQAASVSIPTYWKTLLSQFQRSLTLLHIPTRLPFRTEIVFHCDLLQRPQGRCETETGMRSGVRRASWRIVENAIRKREKIRGVGGGGHDVFI